MNLSEQLLGIANILDGCVNQQHIETRVGPGQGMDAVDIEHPAMPADGVVFEFDGVESRAVDLQTLDIGLLQWAVHAGHQVEHP